MTDLKSVNIKGRLKYADWSLFKAVIDGDEYSIEAKIFKEPSEFGINGGKISKLGIRSLGVNGQEISYDRGWDIEPPKSGNLKKVYDTFIMKYN